MQDEFEFFKWFYQEADFGPADYDVRLAMFDEYERKTGKKVPETIKDEG